MSGLQYKKCLLHHAVKNIYELFNSFDVLGSVFHVSNILYLKSRQESSGFFDFGVW
jgi:hypothetical protein